VWRQIGWALAFAGLVLVAVGVAFAAVVGVAALTPVPAWFLGAGWLVLALGVFVAVRLTAAPPWRWRLFAVTLVVLTVAGGLALFLPANGTPPPAPAGMRMVDLPTGSRLAYLKLDGASGAGQPPVVFLHGGPGVADMAGDAESLRGLAGAGFDVYLYDQLGAGRSMRLADPTGYTMARAVADLDAFRVAIGAGRVRLLGYSWGATLASAYLAAHADRVEKVVFVSPGPMVRGGSDFTDLTAHLDSAGKRALYGQALQPRALLAWTLTQVDPRAAHAYAGDAEMDARYRRISAAVSPGLFCRPHPPAEADVGFYANASLLRPGAAVGPDPHPALRQVRVPALVMKGSCDYLSWSSAVDYRDTLPGARLVYLPGAGHQLYAERTDVFVATVRAFLAGQPLPLPADTSRAAPPDYRGPA
jgi:proline iminopeptidase